MQLGTPVIDGNTQRMGVVSHFGEAGPDGDRLVTVRFGTGNLGFYWRSAFLATGLISVDGTVWRVN